MAKKMMTVRLDQELIDRMDVLANRVGMTRTDIIERSILAGLKEGESLASKMENPLVRGILDAVLALDPTATKEDAATLKKVKESIKASASNRRKKMPRAK